MTKNFKLLIPLYLAAIFFLLLLGCAADLPELLLEENRLGTIIFQNPNIKGEPYYIDYTGKEIQMATFEKEGAIYLTRIYSIKTKGKPALLKEMSTDEKYTNLFWDSTYLDVMSSGERCLGGCLAGTPVGGTIDRYGLTLLKILNNNAVFVFKCETETKHARQIGGSAQEQREWGESLSYYSSQFFMGINNFTPDPANLQRVSYSTRHRPRFPWLAKIYPLRASEKYAFISSAVNKERAVYIFDIQERRLKGRVLNLMEHPFIDLAIIPAKKLVLYLREGPTQKTWQIDFVHNSSLFEE